MSVTRLDFELPEFVRTVWVSDVAREVWEPRIERIGRVWGRIERASIGAGVRPVAQVRVVQGEVGFMEREAGLNGLAVEVLGGEIRKEGREELRELVIGRGKDLGRFVGAWEAGDEVEMGRLLGYPACCCRFYGEMGERWGDLVWPMVLNTADKTAYGETVFEVAGQGGTNVLLERLGVKLVAHRPCGFDCEGTVRLAERFVQVGREIGFGEEMDWLEGILNWPMEWSMLHGIVEVKTPVFKVSMNGVATGEKVGVRVLGDGYPEEGGVGVGFPYRRPERLRVSESKGFRRGVENCEL